MVDSDQWMFFNLAEVEMNNVEELKEVEEKVITVVEGTVEGTVWIEGAEAVIIVDIYRE